MVRKRKDTPEARAFWEDVERAARDVESWPYWKRGMSKDIKSQLEDVFGGGGQVAPGGTGAVLTRPSGIDLEIATQVLRQVALDSIDRDLGAVAAREVANELERHGLKPADFAHLPDFPPIVAQRIVSRLVKSEEFARAFRKYLGMRG